MNNKGNKKQVPLIDLKAQFSQIRNEVYLALKEVIESQEFILGPKVETLRCQSLIDVLTTIT